MVTWRKLRNNQGLETFASMTLGTEQVDSRPLILFGFNFMIENSPESNIYRRKIICWIVRAPPVARMYNRKEKSCSRCINHSPSPQLRSWSNFSFPDPEINSGPAEIPRFCSISSWWARKYFIYDWQRVYMTHAKLALNKPSGLETSGYVYIKAIGGVLIDWLYFKISTFVRQWKT